MEANSKDAVYFAEGSARAIFDERRASELLEAMLAALGPMRRVLLIPPDYSRLHSWAGPLTRILFEMLRGSADVRILPAVGTHKAMSDEQMTKMFPGVPNDCFLTHDFRKDVVRLGEVPAGFVRKASDGAVDYSIPIEVSRHLLETQWDRIFSIGQLVPHEVIGIANHVKNVLVGTGGAETIHKTHYLGAVHGMERIMGRANTPVRAVLQEGMNRFGAYLPITYVLTVRGFRSGGDEGGPSSELVTRGLFAGDGERCFSMGAELCQQVNRIVLPRPPKKVVVWLDPEEFRSTWLGNKAIYRTRMAVADGGEVIVLAPGIREFGEDLEIDRLIRRYGYRGTPATVDAVAGEPELAQNLSAAAHLIHGSSEGRFHVTYCPGALTKEEIESVGFRYGDLAATIRRYDPSRLRDGWNDVAGQEIYFVRNPGQGLWMSSDRTGESD